MDELEDYLRDDSEDEWCLRCQGDGRIICADGYHEYIGYSYEACPDCEAGERVANTHGIRW